MIQSLQYCSKLATKKELIRNVNQQNFSQVHKVTTIAQCDTLKDFHYIFNFTATYAEHVHRSEKSLNIINTKRGKTNSYGQIHALY